MSFFRNLFVSKKAAKDTPPENNQLLQLIRAYNANKTMDHYKPVLQELKSGPAHLLLPCNHISSSRQHGQTMLDDEEVELTSVFDREGTVILGAFTAEKPLFEWAQGETPYKKISGQNLLLFCQKRGVDRIVIDSNQPTEFILEQQIKPGNKSGKVRAKIKTPKPPISAENITRFQEKFRALYFIQEVYQFEIIKEDETILNLAFRLDEHNAENRNSCFNTVQTVIKNTEASRRINVILLDNEVLYQAAQKIENSLIYTR